MLRYLRELNTRIQYVVIYPVCNGPHVDIVFIFYKMLYLIQSHISYYIIYSTFYFVFCILYLVLYLDIMWTIETPSFNYIHILQYQNFGIFLIICIETWDGILFNFYEFYANSTKKKVVIQKLLLVCNQVVSLRTCIILNINYH